VARYLRDAADEPVARDDRRLLVDAAVPAGGDHDLLVELAAPADDARVHGRVVARIQRAVDEVGPLTQLAVLPARRRPEHAPAPQSGARAGGEGLGSRSRYRRAQDRADTAVASQESS